MKQFMNTFKNCCILRSFSYFNMLYNEVQFRINRMPEFGKAVFQYYLDDDNDLPWIRIGKFDNHKNKTTALLHEIGHYIDRQKFSQKKKYNRTPKIKREKQAWKHALRLSDKYNLQINLYTAQKWLSSYNTNYKVLDNKLRRQLNERSN